MALGTGSTSCSDSGSGGGETGSGTGDSTGGDESGPDVPDPEPEVDWPQVACDPLVPSFCAFPFPSNVFTVPDDSTSTGRRLALPPEAMPSSYYDVTVDPGPWNRLDGFSPGLPMMAHFEGASSTGLPMHDEIDRSMQPDSPTIVLEAETGERVPHFAVLDASGRNPDQATLIIRPVVRLKDSTRYIVAIRDLVDAQGETLPASEAFAALRDGASSEDSSVESRRPLYADIFSRLDRAGVERASLQLAWDFTTASRENNTAAMVHMRDEALALVGDKGPEYTIEEVLEDPMNGVALRITGKMKVPLYLDKPGPGASLVYGDDGLPEINPERPWAEYPFTVWVPPSAKEEPASLAQFGHGMFGDQNEVDWFEIPFSANYNYVVFATDWIGMASDGDRIHVAGVLDSGEFERFETMTDRLQQGVLNALLAMRMMSGRFVDEPLIQFDGKSAIDPSRRFYYGSSQGGIIGGTYMALSTDVERGMLDTPGQPYSLLLARSANFDEFFDLLWGNYEDDRDVQMILSLAQMLWDRSEPDGFTPYITSNPLPGTPTHQVMIRPALGDHQVTNLGAHHMARTVGAVHLDTGIREIWGLQKVESVQGGSALVEYDFGLPTDPLENRPQRECEDPHDKLREVPVAAEQLDHFFQTGEIANFCPGRACRFPAMSGCPGG